MGNSTKDIPEFPPWDDPAFHKIHCDPYHYRASGPRAIENFLDVTRFPFVHTGLLSDPVHAEVNDYQVETAAEGITAKDITVWQPDPGGTGKGALVTYTYKVLRPLTASFVKS